MLSQSAKCYNSPVIPVTRRAFVSSLAGIALLPSARVRRAPARIDAAALRRRIEELSVCGRPEGGTFASGVSRVAYSDADVQGREYVMKLMRGAGLQPRVDPAGNIFARRAGGDPQQPPILFGSHI